MSRRLFLADSLVELINLTSTARPLRIDLQHAV